jgi:uncharacterized delta-60 repeat protein
MANKFLINPLSGGNLTVVTGTSSGGGGVSAHGDLTGLGSDDHAQYVKGTGRAGGQTISGGLSASDSLVLESTADATKGTVDISDPTRVNDVDALTAVTLQLGKSTATKVELAKSGVDTEIKGKLDVAEGLDVIGTLNIVGTLSTESVDYSTQLKLGTVTAPSVDISKSGATTTISGSLEAKEGVTVTGDLITDDIDTASGVTLTVGKATATKVEVADTGVETEMKGPITASEGITVPTGFDITLTDGPVATTDAANKAYVDAVAAGLTIKSSVNLATDAALPAYTYNNGTDGVGATITADANGALTVDGIVASIGDRILVKDGASGIDNGIYNATAIGDGSNPFILTRAEDADNSPEGEMAVGMFIHVLYGTNNEGSGFALTASSPDPVDIGTSLLTFTEISSVSDVTGANIGDGLGKVFDNKNGNTLNFKSIKAGSAKVTITNDTVNDNVEIDVVATQIDHGDLTGKGDDDHTQYTLLAGRSGGQTVIGGIDASDNLVLQSTSDATRGVVEIKDDTDITSTTTSTTISTGALTVAGGVGITENLSVGGIVRKNAISASLPLQQGNATNLATEGAGGALLAGATNNTAYGDGALNAITIQDDNSAFGKGAMSGYQGNLSVAIGANALAAPASTGGDTNTAIGANSMSNQTTGSSNVSIGNSSMMNLSEGGGNVAIGMASALSLTTGISNVMIGTGVAASLDGNDNVALGSNTNIQSGVSNSIALGRGATATANNQFALSSVTEMVTAVDGECDIGTTGKKFNNIHLAGDVNSAAVAASGVISTTDTTASTTTITGSIVTAGGVGVAGAITVGGAVSAATVPTAGAHLTNKTYVDAESAKALPLAGGTMTGVITTVGVTVPTGNAVTLIDAPSAGTDAANKTYVDTMLPLAGGTMTGDIDMDSNKIINLTTPIEGTDAANKTYVDNLLNSTITRQKMSDTVSDTQDTGASYTACAADTSNNIVYATTSVGIEAYSYSADGVMTLLGSVSLANSAVIQLDGATAAWVIAATQLYRVDITNPASMVVGVGISSYVFADIVIAGSYVWASVGTNELVRLDIADGGNVIVTAVGASGRDWTHITYDATTDIIAQTDDTTASQEAYCVTVDISDPNTPTLLEASAKLFPNAESGAPYLYNTRLYDDQLYVMSNNGTISLYVITFPGNAGEPTTDRVTGDYKYMDIVGADSSNVFIYAASDTSYDVFVYNGEYITKTSTTPHTFSSVVFSEVIHDQSLSFIIDANGLTSVKYDIITDIYGLFVNGGIDTGVSSLTTPDLYVAGGMEIVKTAKLTSLNMSSGIINNVAEGMVDTDAVNKGQTDRLYTSSKDVMPILDATLPMKNNNATAAGSVRDIFVDYETQIIYAATTDGVSTFRYDAEGTITHASDSPTIGNLYQIGVSDDRTYAYCVRSDASLDIVNVTDIDNIVVGANIATHALSLFNNVVVIGDNLWVGDNTSGGLLIRYDISTPGSPSEQETTVGDTQNGIYPNTAKTQLWGADGSVIRMFDITTPSAPVVTTISGASAGGTITGIAFNETDTRSYTLNTAGVVAVANIEDLNNVFTLTTNDFSGSTCSAISYSTITNEPVIYVSVAGVAKGIVTASVKNDIIVKEPFQSFTHQVFQSSTSTDPIQKLMFVANNVDGVYGLTFGCDVRMCKANIVSGTDSVSAETGSIVTAGGIGVAKNLTVGGTVATKLINLSGASTENKITVPDNITNALIITDAGGQDYITLDTTDALPRVEIDADLQVGSDAQFIGGITAFAGIVIPTGQDITLTDAPVAGNDAANKTYVDTMLPLAGGTMTGALTTTALTAANLVYPTSDGVSGQVMTTDGFGALTFTTISAGGGGDMVGPAGATDNAVARFDTTTGKLVQDSGVLIDDSNNISGANDVAIDGDLTVVSTVISADPYDNESNPFFGTDGTFQYLIAGDSSSTLSRVSVTTSTIFSMSDTQSNAANVSVFSVDRATGALNTGFGAGGYTVLDTAGDRDTVGVVPADSGSVVAAWTDQSFDVTDAEIRLQKLGTDGLPVTIGNYSPTASFGLSGDCDLYGTHLIAIDATYGLAVGYTDYYNNTDEKGLVILKFTLSTGVLDATFGSVSGVTHINPFLNGTDLVTKDVALQSDGSIIVMGAANNETELFVHKFDSTGATVGVFGASGTYTQAGYTNQYTHMTIFSDDHIYVGNSSGNNADEATFIRLDKTTGAKDGTFGTAGELTITMAGGGSGATGAITAMVYNNGFIYAGFSRSASTGGSIIRFDSTGTQDLTYGTAGVLDVTASSVTVNELLFDTNDTFILGATPNKVTNIISGPKLNISDTVEISNNLSVGGGLGVTGGVSLTGIAYPASDGINGQVMTTDGNGTLSFSTISTATPTDDNITKIIPNRYLAVNGSVGEVADSTGLVTVIRSANENTKVISDSGFTDAVTVELGEGKVDMAPDNFVIIEGSSNNDGIYEVATFTTGTPNILVIKGSPTYNFTENSFTVDSNISGNVRPVTISMIRSDGTGWETVTGSVSSAMTVESVGDMVGPASATDNAIARFDAATGKLVQDSSVLIDDSNNVTGVAGLDVSGQLAMNVDIGGPSTANIHVQEGNSAVLYLEGDTINNGGNETVGGQIYLSADLSGSASFMGMGGPTSNNDSLTLINSHPTFTNLGTIKLQCGGGFTATPGSLPAFGVSPTTVMELTSSGIDANVVTNITDTTQSTIATDGALVVTGGAGIAMNLNVGGDVTVTGTTILDGNLIVNGTTTSVDSEVVNIADNYMAINSGYTAASAETGGLVVNYLPTDLKHTIGSFGFVAGVVGVSPVRLGVSESTIIFTSGDIVQISGSVQNDGIYEFQNYPNSGEIHLRGIGGVAPTEDFSQNQLVTDTSSGTITKVNVSVIRANGAGGWECGMGSSTPIVYHEFATEPFVNEMVTLVNDNPTPNDSFGTNGIFNDGAVEVKSGAKIGSVIYAPGVFGAAQLTMVAVDSDTGTKIPGFVEPNVELVAEYAVVDTITDGTDAIVAIVSTPASPDTDTCKIAKYNSVGTESYKTTVSPSTDNITRFIGISSTRGLLFGSTNTPRVIVLMIDLTTGSDTNADGFGDSGMGTAIADIGIGNEVANDGAVQSDGGIISVGVANDGSSWMFVHRFTSGGLTDAGFAASGVFSKVGFSDGARRVGIFADDSICIEVGTGSNVKFMKLSATGIEDTNFGTAGELDIAFSENTAPVTMTLKDDMMYVALSGATTSTIVRFDVDGVLDTTFGTAGKLTIPEAVPVSGMILDDLDIFAVGGTTSDITKYTITQTVTIEKDLTVNGTANLSGNSYPTATGTAGQVLTTDGSGTLTFEDAAGGGGGATVYVDTTTPVTAMTDTFVNVLSLGALSLSAGDWVITANVDLYASAGRGLTRWYDETAVAAIANSTRHHYCGGTTVDSMNTGTNMIKITLGVDSTIVLQASTKVATGSTFTVNSARIFAQQV